MNCPRCKEPVLALREVEDFYRFYVHRSETNTLTGRTVVIGCKVTLLKSVEIWTSKQFDKSKLGGVPA